MSLYMSIVSGRYDFKNKMYEPIKALERWNASETFINIRHKTVMEQRIEFKLK